MANPEHLEILKQGVEAWNEWREHHPKISPDLSEINLSDWRLASANFRNTNLYRTDFRQGDLTRTNFRAARLALSEFYNAQLSGANFTAAGLSGASFYMATLVGADFTNADLSWAKLRGAILDNANFRGAGLIRADFTEAVFRHTNLSNTWVMQTAFIQNNLNEVIGLETVIHGGPSEISNSTLSLSEGDIPETFLRGCGLKDWEVEAVKLYQPNLTPTDISDITRRISMLRLDPRTQFYACFISFTEADDAFSERIYNDLQAKGVRCWRWKEDAKWGRTLMRSIDEAVRVYDKLIVICSEQSLNSPAVIREIERALQKEDEQSRQGKEGEVLFPIRLDDYIFTGWQHHRKADVTAKNVGDFRQWKDHDSYQKAFDRLLRDLKAGE